MAEKNNTGNNSGTKKTNTQQGAKKKPSASKTRKYRSGSSNNGKPKAGSSNKATVTSKTAKKTPRAKKKTSVKRGLFWRLFWALVIFIALAFAVWVIWLDYQVRSQFSGKRWELPAQVYARPLELFKQADINSEKLFLELQALGYREVSSLSGPGEYRIRSTKKIDLYTRSFHFTDGNEKGQKVRLTFSQGRIENILNLDSKTSLPLLRLDPALVGSLYPRSGEDRLLLSLEQTPELLVKGLIATEDKRFYQHFGVDFRGIARAVVNNIKAGGLVEGGSSLTQQLVKNFFLTSERTLRRKINEAMMALILEFRFEKNDILEAYLNEIYLGQDGARAVHGFGLASHYYFGKPVQELNLAEISLLIGMVKGPSYYNPRRNKQRAMNRRGVVLGLMSSQGIISNEQADKANASDVRITAKGSMQQNRFPAYIDFVKKQLLESYAEEDLTTEGLRIFTTFDPIVQQQAQRAVKKRITQLRSSSGRSDASLQAASVITSAHNGELLAIVGNADGFKGAYNRALKMKRPVGSLLKPGVYLSALQQPDSYHLGTIIDDAPIELELENGDIWQPQNYDEKSHGKIPLWQGLAKSYNIAAVRLSQQLGLSTVMDTMEKLGLPDDIPHYPSVVLGAVELSPLQIAQMYQTFASGGYYQPINAIREVRTATGESLKRYPLEFYSAISSADHFAIQYALYQTTRLGSAKALNWLLPNSGVLAGKTGTTNDLRDSWYAGYDADKLAVVWVGYDDNKSSGLTGASGALRVWASIFAATGSRDLQFRQTQNITMVDINSQDGLRADKYCTDTVQLPVIGAAERIGWSPCAKPDDGDDSGIKNWFRRLWN